MEKPSVVVFAYHNVGLRCLSVLLAGGVDVRLVVTHADDPAEQIWFGSVARLAHEYDIETITPADPNAPDVMQRIAQAQPDFLFSFYYRNMLKAPLLALPPRGAWNMHGSLLPKYRGRVPVNWAIIHGETETGATLHRMVEKPDAGEIAAQTAVPILPNDSAREVFDKVTVAAELTLHRCLPALLAGTAVLTAQDLARGSYYGGRKAQDGCIDWAQPAHAVHNLVRAVTRPYPGAYSDTARGRLVVWRTLPLEQTTAGMPELYAEDGQYLARCGDSGVLKILDAEIGGKPLTPDMLPLELT